ncbi:MAG: hypothetical protein V3573_06755 [Desulfovibrionaceae bacterium]
MKRLIGPLAALTICCCVSACASRPASAPLMVTQRLEICPSPAPLPMVPMVRGQHIGSAANVEAIVENFKRLRLEIDALRGALRCYENQSGEARP